MPRVRKYHNGGKGSGHPHSNKASTKQDSLDVISSSQKMIDELLRQGYVLTGDLEKGGDASSKTDEENLEFTKKLLEETEKWFEGNKHKIPEDKQEAVLKKIESYKKQLEEERLESIERNTLMDREYNDDGTFLSRESDVRWINEDLPKILYNPRISPTAQQSYYSRVRWGDVVNVPLYDNIHWGAGNPEPPISEQEAYKKFTKGFFPAEQREQEPLLGLLKPRVTTVDLDSKELQESNVSIYKGPKHPTQRVMKGWGGVRTKQIPSHDMVWSEKKNKYLRREIEPEEIERYKQENRIRNPTRIKASFNEGGALKKLIKKYHEGGKGPGHPHPAGYTAPVIPGLTDNNPLIGLIDAPREDRLSEFDEVKKADWSTILANPMQAWEHISKNGFTRPTQAELDSQKHNIYDGITSMFNPAAYIEAVKGVDSSLTAADEALLSGMEDGSLSPGDLSKIMGNMSDAGLQALFLSMAPMGGRTLLGAAKELRRPALNTLTQEFRGSRLLGATTETASTPLVMGDLPMNIPASPLRQLAGDAQLAIKPAAPKVKGKGKGKGKKYEPSNPYEESNVAKTVTEGGSWSTTNPGVYQYPSFMTGSKLEGQVSAKDGTIARTILEQLAKNKNTKPSEALAIEDVLGEFEGKRIPYGSFKQSLALDIRSAEIIKTDSYAGTGVEALGYVQDVDTHTNSPTLRLKYQVTPTTKLYKDKSLGLTKEGESHFPDQPHSFWIRSMSTAEEPNVLKALEWQTDVKSLRDPSKGLSASEEAADYYPERISLAISNAPLFGGDPVKLSLEKQIKIFKDEIGKTKKNFGPLEQVPIGYTEYLAQLEKGLEIALAARLKGGEARIAKANSKGLPLKFVNESLLDAARQGKEYLDVPTAETVFTIEGWDRPNNAELELLARNQHDILRAYDNSLTNVSEHRLELLEDLTNEIKSSISINNSVESLINKGVKVQKKAYDQFISNFENHKPIPVSILNDLNFDSGMQEYVFSKLKEISTEENLKNGFEGIKKEKLRRDFIAYIKNLKSEVGIKAKQDITKFKEAQKKLDEIKAKGFDLSKISESEMSVTKNYRNFPKLWKSEFGTDVKRVTDSKGNNWMRVKIPENFYQNDISLPPSEIKTYRKGGKALKGLMKKYNEGGLFQRLRDKRAKRRIDKTPVRQARTSELLDVLASDQPTTKGRYYPKEKEIVMYRDDDPDTLKHEQVHASQYGPLQRLSYLLKFNDSARIQDPAKRKTYRKLTSGKNIVDDREFNPAGQYVLSRGEEFEAVLDTGVNAAKEQGVDFSKSYDDILSQLLSAPSPTNNMTGLRKFMDNKFTKEQRDLILKSIR